MGYERNDRRYGGIPGERDRTGYGQDGDRARAPWDAGREPRDRDYGNRDYGGRDHASRDYRPAPGHDRQRDDRDRGFLDRAGDEVRSWFGDEDAERRRHRDERDDERPGARGGHDDRDRARGARSGNPDHDPSYLSWRDRQMQAFDRDYDDYRRENQSKFDKEFHGWRQTRQGQRELVRQVREHQEVVGCDGAHIGKVDHVRGDHIQLAKNDEGAGGHHHAIPFSWIQSVDDKVTLNRTADQAKQQWREDDDSGQRQRGALFGKHDDDRDAGGSGLNRSFSGTY